MTMRTREAAVVAGIGVVLIGTLILVAVLMQVGGVEPAMATPSALATQDAPAQSVVAEAISPAASSTVIAPSAQWVEQTSQSSGIPSVAVDAYGSATLQIARTDPSCHLGWTTLAGVGTVESGNGTGGGRELLASGLSSSPITGPLLNGAGGYAAIGDGQGGWSSAEGPMQFIESTWQRWGADGNGDGVKDVNNIFDAALAAGHYLCADSHDLSTAQGWTAAIFSYNHDVKYVQAVYAAANAAAR